MQNNPNIVPKPKPEDLRTEYQVCQQSADGESLSYWAFAGVFLAFSSVVLGNIFTKIFETHSTSFRVTATLISVGMVIIYWALIQMLKRANRRNGWYYERMREIEDELGLEIMKNQKCRMGRTSGYTYFKVIIHILIVFWLIVIGLVWAG